MRYVVDSCVALKVVLPEVDSARATRLFDEFNQGIHDLLAPDLFTPEVANALVSAERQGRIKPGEAAIFVGDLLQVAPTLVPVHRLLGRAMEMALASRKAVYDCFYVALAEHEGCDFVTSDDRLIKGLGSTFPFLIRLSALP